jgi:hypothetical protein
MKRKAILLMTCFVVYLLFSSLSIHGYAWEEGGYCGNDPITPNVVYSFIKHFSYEQYYWGAEHQFTYNNDNRVDAMDFAYYCGHGSPWEIGVYANGAGSGTSAYIDLETAGNSSDKGYGDDDLEFIVFHSCQTIPSPIEFSNWWSPWISEADDIFDGLHQALGFRTNAYKYTADNIADYFGARMAGNNYVWQSWFDAIDAHGDHSGNNDYGAAVMHPDAEFDRYKYSHSPDPPENHGNLLIWYQY